MMFMISLLTLLIASLSALLCANTREDVFRAAMGCVSLLFAFVTLVIAPWGLKLLLIAIPLIVEAVSRRSAANID